MVQQGTFLDVVDNSGAKQVYCIKILNTGYKQRYARVGDLILISVKKIKNSKHIKVKKGEMHRALIVKTKSFIFFNTSNYKKYSENSVVLLNKQNKMLGTRIFGKISKNLKYTKYLKLASLASGVFF